MATQNTKEQYFNSLKLISEKVHVFIYEKIKHLESDCTPELYEQIERLPIKRQRGNIFRALLTDLLYKTLSSEPNENLVALCSLSELNNYNAYLDNWILDNKVNIWNRENPRKEISYITIASGMYREMVEKIISELSLSDRQKLDISTVMSLSMNLSYQGQALDMRMSIENFDDYQMEQKYLDMYEKKSLLQSGYLYGASAEIGAILANANAETVQLAREIGKMIGTGLHISNDLGDFAILDQDTDFKFYQDQLADLKNGRLTLPIWYVLKNGTEQEKKLFRESVNKEIDKKDQMIILRTLHSSGAYAYCKKLIRKYCSESKKLIKKLPESDARNILYYSTVIIRNNKYLANLNK
ncbi:MAG: hypothetical protein HGA67_01770 [Candidatus Yonathbacteria bacterium]|nr:hypothetical protein [Candidatus Yonathbacteria bacterium]